MNHTHPTEKADLLTRARTGDQSAFAALLAQYSPMIEKQLSRTRADHPTLCDSDLEDLRQEAFLAFYRALLSFDPARGEVSFGLYAKICVENGLISACRKIRPSAEPLDDEALEDLCHAGDEDDPTRPLRDEETLRALSSVIERTLSPYENVIWCRYVAGETVPEIARSLGKDTRSVHNAVYRIRQKLRTALRARGMDFAST